jgi:hypothetical protein
VLMVLAVLTVLTVLIGDPRSLIPDP